MATTALFRLLAVVASARVVLALTCPVFNEATNFLSGQPCTQCTSANANALENGDTDICAWCYGAPTPQQSCVPYVSSLLVVAHKQAAYCVRVCNDCSFFRNNESIVCFAHLSFHHSIACFGFFTKRQTLAAVIFAIATTANGRGDDNTRHSFTFSAQGAFTNPCAALANNATAPTFSLGGENCDCSDPAYTTCATCTANPKCNWVATANRSVQVTLFGIILPAVTVRSRQTPLLLPPVRTPPAAPSPVRCPPRPSHIDRLVRSHCRPLSLPPAPAGWRQPTAQRQSSRQGHAHRAECRDRSRAGFAHDLRMLLFADLWGDDEYSLLLPVPVVDE